MVCAGGAASRRQGRTPCVNNPTAATARKPKPKSMKSRLAFIHSAQHPAVTMQFVSGSTRALACSDRRPRRSEPSWPRSPNGERWKPLLFSARARKTAREGACAPHFLLHGYGSVESGTFPCVRAGGLRRLIGNEPPSQADHVVLRVAKPAIELDGFSVGRTHKQV